MMIFPLVFGYGMDPAQGPALVFDVLPRVFTEIPGGPDHRNSVLFCCWVLAATTPSIALLEPGVAWLIRDAAVSAELRLCGSWGSRRGCLGLGTVLSFKPVG